MVRCRGSSDRGRRWRSCCCRRGFDAAEALALGLVNKVVPRDELDAAVASVDEFARHGPARLAVANAKRLVRESLDRTLPEQLAAEARSFAQCAGTADFVEGVTAFVAKRPPKFGGG